MHLPNPWSAVPTERAARLDAELQRELVRSHRLHGVDVHAVATRDDCDDVLFLGASGDVFCVHLTWSAESSPAYPRTQAYRNLDEFAHRWPLEHSHEIFDDDAG